MTRRVKLSGDPAYIYAVGRVRARERRLLTTRALTVSAEARTLEAAVDALREAGYELTTRNSAGLEELITDKTRELVRFLRESLSDGKLLTYLRLPLDYTNLKTALLRRLTEKKLPSREGGGLSLERLNVLAGGGEPTDLTEPFGNLARELLEEWEKSQDPFPLQQGVDRALYARQVELAGEIGLPFLTAYLELQIDLVNLDALARCLAAPNPEELAPAVFIPGGSLDISRMENLARTGDRTGSIDYVSRTPYAEIALAAVEGIPDGLSNLAVRGATYKIDFLMQARYASFGSEPVIAYYLAKQNELDLVRFVLTCKMNDVPPKAIAARMWGVS